MILFICLDFPSIIFSGKGGLILREIVEISLAGRAPKQEPLLFALALCARYKTQNWKHLAYNYKEADKEIGAKSPIFEKYMYQLNQTAFKAVKKVIFCSVLDIISKKRVKVCRIPTHLFAFVKFCELISKSTTPKDIDLVDGGSTGWGRSMRKCISEWCV